jgi:hypothetical protein
MVRCHGTRSQNWWTTKGSRNRATEEARAAAAATGVLPLDYMLSVMRDLAADHKRRDATAMAAAPYLHPKLGSIDAMLGPATSKSSDSKVIIKFVLPRRDDAQEDQLEKEL